MLIRIPQSPLNSKVFLSGCGVGAGISKGPDVKRLKWTESIACLFERTLLHGSNPEGLGFVRGCYFCRDADEPGTFGALYIGHLNRRTRHVRGL